MSNCETKLYFIAFTNQSTNEMKIIALWSIALLVEVVSLQACGEVGIELFLWIRKMTCFKRLLSGWFISLEVLWTENVTEKYWKRYPRKHSAASWQTCQGLNLNLLTDNWANNNALINYCNFQISKHGLNVICIFKRSIVPKGLSRILKLASSKFTWVLRLMLSRWTLGRALTPRYSTNLFWRIINLVAEYI